LISVRSKVQIFPGPPFSDVQEVSAFRSQGFQALAAARKRGGLRALKVLAGNGETEGDEWEIFENRIRWD
jgi:hypothetical protein